METETGAAATEEACQECGGDGWVEVHVTAIGGEGGWFLQPCECEAWDRGQV